MKPLLEVQKLSKRFPLKKQLFQKQQFVHALNDLSLSINKGETLAIVGESGSGKSTLGRCILQLCTPDKGKIIFREQEITNLSPKQMLPFRKDLQIVFQDPFSSLNPRMSVGEIIGEALLEHKLFPSVNQDYYHYIHAIMTHCGLEHEHIHRYPHQFSGGQRQRIGIARALALKPSLLIADEAVSALDVSVRAQIIKLLKDLQAELGLSYLFISHDLGVVKHIAHRVAVMYLGRIVELASIEELFQNPKHPYTQSLIDAAPLLSSTSTPVPLKGEIPSNIDLPLGCAFASRCPKAQKKCQTEQPLLEGSGCLCACFYQNP